MLAHHAAVSEACRRPLSSDLQARIVMLGLLMAPRRVTSHRKIRVGGRTDGGYVMLDDFARLQTAFSLGVGPNVDWDYAIAERGIAVHQFDHTVSGPPKRHPGFHFNKRRIDAQASGDTDNLETLLERNGSTARFSNLLKLDIEGSEWALLAEADAGSLSRFPQILCEVHDLALVHDDKHFDLMMRALRRLRENFRGRPCARQQLRRTTFRGGPGDAQRPGTHARQSRGLCFHRGSGDISDRTGLPERSPSSRLLPGRLPLRQDHRPRHRHPHGASPENAGRDRVRCRPLHRGQPGHRRCGTRSLDALESVGVARGASPFAR